jgi:hypothetical protein
MPRSDQSQVLEKMANLQGLRAVYLSNCSEDWSVLTKIRSLRLLTLSSCEFGLLDCSPFMKVLSLEKESDGSPWLQEWKRSNSEHKFRLTKLRLSYAPSEKACQLIPLETHLEQLNVSPNKSLVDVLPRCRSIRFLDLDELDTDEQIASLSKALLLAPFIHSLTVGVSSLLDLSSLPLSTLKSFKLTACNSTLASVSKALTTSKPKSLTSLELLQLKGSFEPLADALLECPSLTNLNIFELHSLGRDILSVVQKLRHLPLVKLSLELYSFTDESIECLLSFLSRSAVQDLILGTLSPKQLQLVADALPSLSCLQSLECDTFEFNLCQHESAHLALFSALTRSSLRSLAVRWSSFRLPVLEACLDKIPETQLTQFHLPYPKVYAEDFDPAIHDENYKQVELGDPIDWNTRFPKFKDRFCLVTLS